MNKSRKFKNLNIIIENKTLKYQITYSNRKSIEIKLKLDGQIFVSAPFYVSIKEIEAFLLKKSKWINDKLIYINSQNEHKESLAERKTVPLNGNDIPFEINELKIKRAKAQYIEGSLIIDIPQGFNEGDKNVLVGEILRKFYKRKTAEYLEYRLGFYEDLIGVKSVRFSVKDQRSRWGSCSSKKNLNFNLRLSMTPKFVFDYVIVHELCHIKEMNHSEDFWRLVSEACPDFKVAKAWFTQNASKLMFI